MKSRTSFFNPTVLKKDITRFAPAWALYGIGMLMVFVLSDTDFGPYYASNMASSTAPMSIVNLFYGLLCAQLLFGDLWNSRMCNALHAMPLRREGWFLTHVLAGLLFSLVPNTVVALISIVLVSELWAVPLLWLAATTMQYLFFFGSAVLACLCVGNRFAMGLVYGLLNFFSQIAYWLIDCLYAPLMQGVIVREDFFLLLSPVVTMMEHDYMDVHYSAVHGYANLVIESGWGYLGICAALGIGMPVLALLSYRRRNLECAGDFIAFRPLAPVFLLLYTLFAGACCFGFASLFGGDDNYLFLLLGLVIGFFTGKMLLERTVRVFRKQNLLRFGIFLLVFIASLVVIRTDLLGIVSWIPKASQVETVVLSTGSRGSYENQYLKDSPSDRKLIEDVIALHTYGVTHPDENENSRQDVHMYISYTLKNGITVEREYYVDVDTEYGRLLRSYMSSPEHVLGDAYTQHLTPEVAYFPDPDAKFIEPAELNSLLDAIIADCNAGNMAQDWAFTYDRDYAFYLELESKWPDGRHHYVGIRCTSESEHVLRWMRAHEVYPEKIYGSPDKM
jgi:ABC-2 type transport system permease protein